MGVTALVKSSYIGSYLLVLAISGCGLAQETKKMEFTARELFYSAADTPAAPTPKLAASKSPGKKKTTPAQSASKSAQPAASTAQVADASGSTTALPGDAQIVKAVAVTAPAPTAGPALGLRYTILKLTGGEMAEVSPDTVFHAGDRIQFNVETNGPGYLYIVSQGSSGVWKPMFPSAEIEDGNNHVDGFHSYMMPPKSRLVFDEVVGMEKIFIVFSRQPEANLENTIYSLQAPKAKPAGAPAGGAAQPKQLLVASVDDNTVGRLRNTYSRDLIVERVDASSPGEKKEKAVYVVNPSGSQDSRVVADLRLVHQ
jgi:Domain of unknown function (DUF4384)